MVTLSAFKDFVRKKHGNKYERNGFENGKLGFIDERTSVTLEGNERKEDAYTNR